MADATQTKGNMIFEIRGSRKKSCPKKTLKTVIIGRDEMGRRHVAPAPMAQPRQPLTLVAVSVGVGLDAEARKQAPAARARALVCDLLRRRAVQVASRRRRAAGLVARASGAELGRASRLSIRGRKAVYCQTEVSEMKLISPTIPFNHRLYGIFNATFTSRFRKCCIYAKWQYNHPCFVVMYVGGAARRRLRTKVVEPCAC